MSELPIRVTLTMVVDNRDFAEFTARLKEAADYAAGVSGCLGQAVTARNLPGEDAAEFVITSDWSDPTSFRRFETSPEQDRITAPLRALRRSGRMELAKLPAAAVRVEGVFA